MATSWKAQYDYAMRGWGDAQRQAEYYKRALIRIAKRPHDSEFVMIVADAALHECPVPTTPATPEREEG